MSYVPLRDSFDLLRETQGLIFELARKIDSEAGTDMHKEACGRDDAPTDCQYQIGAFYEAPSEFVIAWLLREGLIHGEQIREAAT